MSKDLSIKQAFTNADEYQVATRETEIYTAAAENFLDAVLSTSNKQLTVFDDSSDTLLAFRDVLSMQYCAGKLNGEAGELAELVFKAFRGNLGVLTAEQRELALKELGDIMWYVARIADLLDFCLSHVMTTNIDKLRDRQSRGVVHGYGDNR